MPQTLRFDLSADPIGETLGVAIKQRGDTEAYAFTSESYGARDTRRLTSLALRDDAYDVTVIARAGGIETTKKFTLHKAIAKVLGVTVGTVGASLHAARQALRRDLEEVRK